MYGHTPAPQTESTAAASIWKRAFVKENALGRGYKGELQASRFTEHSGINMFQGSWGGRLRYGFEGKKEVMAKAVSPGATSQARQQGTIPPYTLLPKPRKGYIATSYFSMAK